MSSHYFSPSTEEGDLRISIVITLFVTVLGLRCGMPAAPRTISFEAIYELVAVAMTGVALVVARLSAMSTSGGAANERLAARFDMGFWHLEPIVLGVNG